MLWRLGLDLGTNSIGWCVLSLNENKEPENLIDAGVRIFSDGRDPKTNEPLAVVRRIARGQRRQLYRRKQRRNAAFRLLQKQGLFPSDKAEALKLKILNPYELRVKALDSKLDPYELGRVLFNFSVHRGFKSNRKDGNTEMNPEAAKASLSQNEMCVNLENEIKKSGCRTLGEFLWKNREKHGGIRFVPGRMPYYPLRQMYIDEFTAVKNAQLPYYSQIDWDGIYDALFRQRPLRTQERGKCQYMPEKERTFKAMPCAQKHRILQEVYNLNYQNELMQIMPLSEGQQQTIIALLDTKKTVKFDSIRKALDLNESCSFNLEKGRSELKGNETAVILRNKKNFGSSWDELSLEEQDKIVEKLITAQEDSEIYDLLKDYELSEEQKKNIAAIVFPSGTSMLCKEVTEKIVHIMEEHQVQFHVAVEKLGYKYADSSVEPQNILPYYGKVLTGSTMGADMSKPESEPEKKYGKISNPTVHVALNQTRTVVNALIKQYGKPSQIVIELSRDLKSSREDKARIQKIQNENRKRNEIVNKIITGMASAIKYPSRNDRLKYLLWEELRGGNSMPAKCLYCGKEIGANELFSKNIEVEHILPYGKTLLDSESNLTVAHASCNAAKGERSPFEAFGSSPRGYKWDEILERVSKLKNMEKKRRFSETAMKDFEENSNFIARQLTDNAYLSKSARKYLSAICSDFNIWSVNGGMTKMMRDKWNIDAVLKRKIGAEEIAHFNLKDSDIGAYKKNRYDHRHHALDAIVIGLTDRSMVQQIATMNAQKTKNRIEFPPFPFAYSELQKKIKDIVVSFKPDHGIEGKLSKETYLGKIKREEMVPLAEIKNKENILQIKKDKVRDDFLAKFNETGNIKDTQAYFKDIYPQVKIYKPKYVTRVPVISLQEKDINSVVDDAIRRKIKEFISEHSGEKFEDIMQRFSEKVWVGKASKESGKKYKIKKVRCFNTVQTPIVFCQDSNPRYLAPEDYFAAVVWKIPTEKKDGKYTYKAQYVRRDEIGKDKKIAEIKPHPAAKKICTIHKGDYLEFSDNGIWYKCRVAGLKGSDGRLDIRPVFSVTDCADWLVATNDNMTEPCWKRQKGQNFISVNILFGEKSARFITVNPIGRVFRKTT